MFPLAVSTDNQPRDLRKLDSLTPNLVPLILTRRSCILVSMLHIRALIKPDCIIVFDSAGSTESEISRKFKWHLEKNIKAGIAAREDLELESEEEIGLVYEHRSVESAYIPRNVADIQGTRIDPGSYLQRSGRGNGIHEEPRPRFTGRLGR